MKSPSSQTDPVMRPEEFRLLRTLFQEKTGMVFGEDSVRQLERRLAHRVVALELGSFSAYHRYLRFHADGEEELQTVYDLITNKETYFFREDYQFHSFRDELLPFLARADWSHGTLTCWSMGCSTGEEAYSIAVVAQESGLYDGPAVRVFGTDLCRQSIAVARRGVYGESSFRSTSPERRSRHFVPTRAGMRVAAHVKDVCHFAQQNLLDLEERAVIDQVDTVFCRNVLIYFSDDARRRVIRAIYERIRPGGYLLLGHSESLLNESSPFDPVHLERDVVYRRPRSRTRSTGGRP